MNTLDIIILIVLLLGTLNGLRQGLIKAFANFVGWIIAIISAIKFSADVAPFMRMSTDPVLQKIMAFVLIIVVVILLTWLISAILSSLLQRLKLGPLNRLAGGLFGGLKSVIIILVIMQTLSAWVSASATWQNSKMVSVLLPYAPLATEFAKETASNTWHEIRNTDAADQQHHASTPDSDASAQPAEQTTRNPFN